METDHTGPESADHLDDMNEEPPKDSTHHKPSEETDVDDVHEADHLSEWDSDSTFDFNEEEWPIHTPKFVKMSYNCEEFPYKIVSEGQRILFGYFFVKEKQNRWFVREKNTHFNKEKRCYWISRTCIS